MSRILLNSLMADGPGLAFSFESAEIETAMDDAEVAQSVAESTADEKDIESMTAQADQLEQQAEGLEDLAMAADRVVEATDNEVMLTEIGAELAALGTDAKPTVLVDDSIKDDGSVSLESYVGKSISTEGLKAMAKKFWDAVKKLVSRIWEKVISFWRKLTDQSKSLVKSAKKLSKRADDTIGKSLVDDGKEIDISNQAQILAVDGKVLKSAGDVLSGLDTLKGETEYYLTKLSEKVIKQGDKLADKITSFDIKDADKSLMAVNGAFKGIADEVGKRVKKKVAKDKRFSTSATIFRSEPILGNKAVFFSFVEGEDTKSPLGYSQAQRSLSLNVQPIEGDLKAPTGVQKMTTFTPADCDKVADVVTEIAEMVGNFNTKTLRELEKARDKVKEATDKSNKDVDDKTKPLDTKMWQSAVNYNTAYAKLCTGVFTQITSLAVTCSRAAINASNASLSQYS